MDLTVPAPSEAVPQGREDHALGLVRTPAPPLLAPDLDQVI